MEDMELASKLRDIVNPTNMAYAAAREGSAFLYERASDEQLIQLAKALLVENKTPEDAFREVFPDYAETHMSQSLYLALLRLRVKAVALMSDLGADRNLSNKELTCLEDEQFKLPVTFNEGQPADDVIKSCFISPESSNPIADLAFVIEVQKRRLISQLREISKQPSSFIMSRQFNATVESIRSLLKDMAHMQVEFGLRRRVPRQIDIRVQNAFQNFIDSLGDDKDAVETLGHEILSILEDKDDVIDASFKEVRAHD